MLYFIEYKIDSLDVLSLKFLPSILKRRFFCFLMHLQAVWNFVNMLRVPFVFIYLFMALVRICNQLLCHMLKARANIIASL